MVIRGIVFYCFTNIIDVYFIKYIHTYIHTYRDAYHCVCTDQIEAEQQYDPLGIEVVVSSTRFIYASTLLLLGLMCVFWGLSVTHG